MSSKYDGAKSDEVKEKLDERWHNTVQTQIACENDFEKKIIYVSAGALSISVALLPFTPNGCHRWVLITGWVLLVGSLICNLSLLLRTLHRCLEEYKTLEIQYRDLKIPKGEQIRQVKECKKDLIYSTLNLICCVLGVLHVLAFFAINI